MIPAIQRPMTAVEWTMLLALSVLWGGSFFFVGVIVNELPPFTIVTIRVGLAAIALWLVAFAMGYRIPVRGDIWRAFFCMGLLNNVIPFSLIVWGQTHIASGLASILNATTPLFTVLIAHVLTTDERLTPVRLFGVVAGLAGTVVLIGLGALSGIGTHVFAQIAVLVAALSYAFAGIYGRRFRELEVPPLLTATGQVTTSTLMLLPVVLLLDEPWRLPMPGLTTWAALAGLAVLSTALAYILYFRILATAGATNLLLVTFLIPVTAILLGVLALGESLSAGHIFGMALITSGLAAIDGRPIRWLGRTARRKA